MTAATVTSVNDVPIVAQAPAGWIPLGSRVLSTSKAIMFHPERRDLWVRKSALVIAGGEYWAEPGAVEAAKVYAAARAS